MTGERTVLGVCNICEAICGLELTIDGCGRVRDAAIKSGSGHKKLDESALVAARQWVLSESEIAKASTERSQQVRSARCRRNPEEPDHRH